MATAAVTRRAWELLLAVSDEGVEEVSTQEQTDSVEELAEIIQNEACTTGSTGVLKVLMLLHRAVLDRGDCALYAEVVNCLIPQLRHTLRPAVLLTGLLRIARNHQKNTLTALARGHPQNFGDADAGQSLVTNMRFLQELRKRYLVPEGTGVDMLGDLVADSAAPHVSRISAAAILLADFDPSRGDGVRNILDHLAKVAEGFHAYPPAVRAQVRSALLQVGVQVPPEDGGEETDASCTVYAVGLDSKLPHKEILAYVRQCGEVVQHRICGERANKSVYAFFQFTCREEAQRLVDCSGAPLGCLRPRFEWARETTRNPKAGRRRRKAEGLAVEVAAAPSSPKTKPRAASPRGLSWASDDEDMDFSVPVEQVLGVPAYLAKRSPKQLTAAAIVEQLLASPRSAAGRAAAAYSQNRDTAVDAARMYSARVSPQQRLSFANELSHRLLDAGLSYADVVPMVS
eukprot:TRINITY_DN3030_c0_g1_i1.p1 TRINITY_DN3030_c0_g1~~TRINITY_DN3030_c0_g1_i1.p1  ORF type:complete len:458 (+),score=194.97 TRINITY_DN3030_c0_g1_i1:68-1441(+)